MPAPAAGRAPEADSGLDGAADVEDPHQGALDDAGEQEAGTEGGDCTIGPRVHAGFQHGDEGHLVEGADPVEVEHVGTGEDAGREQTDKDGEGPVGIPEVVSQFLIHVFLICRS